MPRTAAEGPAISAKNPLLANIGTLYKHEIGSNDDGAALPFELIGPRKFVGGKNNAFVANVWPDATTSGTVAFNISAYRYPQSVTASYDKDLSVTATTEFLTTRGGGRFVQYTWAGEELDQEWNMGQWYHELQEGATQ